MQIHSFSRVLALPLLLAALGILYYSFTIDNTHSIWIFLPVVLLVVTYVFNGQIDHYYHRRWPLNLDEKLKQWLTNYFPFYNHSVTQDKEKFEYRLGYIFPEEH